MLFHFSLLLKLLATFVIIFLQDSTIYVWKKQSILQLNYNSENSVFSLSYGKWWTAPHSSSVTLFFRCLIDASYRFDLY